MNVYLVRHGIALDTGEQGVRKDADRPLSEDGRTKTRQAARGLLQVPAFNTRRILSSPLVRAVQTAEIFADELEIEGRVETLPELACGGDVTAIADWLEKQPPVSIMLVGHMPDLSDLASCLACSSGSVRSVFKKASVMSLFFEQRGGAGKGCIEWHLQPSTLRRLAAGNSE